MSDSGAMDTLLAERRRLLGRIQQQQEQVETMEKIVKNLGDQLARDEGLLQEIDSVLGKSLQLQIDDANVLLRGQRLEKVALRVLAEQRGQGSEVHYQEWFELLRAQGHLIAGKKPINTFLSQINRSKAVEPVGHRSGRYRLIEPAA